MLSSLSSLSGLLGIAFASGVNLYAAVLMVGLGIRFNLLQGLPAELQPLANPIVLGVAAVLYVMEFVADKIPVVSAVWDTIHTVIRPLGAAAMALAATAKLGPLEQTLVALLGGGLALTSHTTKMGVRLLAHGTGEPVTQAGLSIIEDVFAFSLVAFASQYPLLTAVIVAVLVVVCFIVIRLVWKALRAVFRGASQRMRSWFGEEPASA